MLVRLQVLLAAVLMCGALPVSGVASPPMAEQVPGEALAYIGWRGAADAPAGFEQTHLKAVLDETKLRPLLTQTLPQLLDHYAADDPQAAMMRETIDSLWPLLWQRSWAFYLSGLDTSMMAHGGPPMPEVGLVIASDGQDEDEALRQQIEQFQMMGLPIELVEGEGYLGLINSAGAHPVAAGGLAESDRFAAALAPLSEEAVAVGYVDVAGLLTLGREQAEASGEVDMAAIYDTLGVDGVQSLGLAAGFAGPRWETRLFINAPAPRQGLVDALLVSDPIDDEHLALVPVTSTWFSASRLDLAKLYDQARELAAQVEPTAQDDLDEMLFMASAMTGVDIEADLLRGLGPVWIAYRDADVAGPTSWLGIALANPLREPERVRVALQGLSQAISEAVQPDWEEDPHFRSVAFEHGGTAVHSFAIPFVQPTWAVHENTLHLGIAPQAVISAIDFADAGGETILDNDNFQAVRNWLGEAQAHSIEFTDLPRTVPGTYGGALMFGQLASSMGIALNPSDDGAAIALLPSLRRLMRHVEPAGQMAWTDDAGWHARTISPFPASTVLGHEGVANPSVLAMSVGTMLPALGAARATARRMESNTQARGIHQSMIMHAQTDDNDPPHLPDDIWVLVEGNHFTPDYALSPHAPADVPWDFETWPETERRQWIRENASYVLLPDLVEDLDTQTVAVFERPDHAHGNTIAVAFNDNRVEALPIEQARQLVMEQTGQTLEQLLERQQTYTDDE